MTLLRTAEANRFIARPDPRRRVVLLFGPDPGGVSERAERLAAALVGNDPFAVTRLEGDEVASDPGRLSDEAYGGSLFAGSRVIRLRVQGNRPLLPAIEPLLERPPPDAWVIIEAGDLRKTAPLRKALEAAPSAAAIGCYPATPDEIIAEEIAVAGIGIADDARILLEDLLASDRLAARSEVRKLCLYAHGAAEITLADVAALIGDAGDYGHDSLADALATGDPAAADRTLQRLAVAGSSLSTAAGVALRHFQALLRARGAVDRGRGTEAAFRTGLPSRRAELERQLRAWPASHLEWASERLARAIADSRLRPAAEAAVIGEALAAVATRAARLRGAGLQAD